MSGKFWAAQRTAGLHGQASAVRGDDCQPLTGIIGYVNFHLVSQFLLRPHSQDIRAFLGHSV